MVDLACEHGPEAVSVSRLVARARVSTKTFYELFDDRSDCLLASIEGALTLAGARACTGCEAHERWIDRVRAGLFELLSFLDEEPALAWLIVIGSAAAGPEALKLRGEALDRLAQVVDEGRADWRVEPPLLTAEATVGGVLSVIHSRLLTPGSGALVDLLNPLMSMIALPYLGTAPARRELRREMPSPRSVPRGSTALDGLVGGDVRLTSRTLAVLKVVSTWPGLSNKEVAERSGITDAGQASRLLARLCERGLLENTGGGQSKGAANAWRLTRRAQGLERVLARRASDAGR
jgi:AcrR family transcriptional regulator